MTTAVSIARWLLDEASTGTTPTTCADNTGNGNTLQIDYSSGDAAWTSIASGNGWEVTAAANTAVGPRLYIANASTTGNIGSSLDGDLEVSLILDGDFATPAASVTLFRIANQDSGSACFAVTMDASRNIILTWGAEYGSYGSYDFGAIPTGRTRLGIQIDSSQATSTNRAFLRCNGSNVAVQGGGDAISLNQAFGIEPGYAPKVTLMNRNAADNNPQGSLYYAELFTGSLTSTQMDNASTALASDNDADWAAAGGSNANLMAGKLGALLAGKL